MQEKNISYIMPMNIKLTALLLKYSLKGSCGVFSKTHKYFGLNSEE